MAITITAVNVGDGDTALASQYNSVVTDLNTIADALDSGGYGVPIGAILPWWAPNNGFALPGGFQVCDGAIIPSGVYAGNNTPNLTSKFMMGTTHALVGTVSGGSNTKDLSHTHSTDISHSHGTHVHGSSAMYAKIRTEQDGSYQSNARLMTVPSWTITQTHGTLNAYGYGGIGSSTTEGTEIGGDTDAATVSLSTTNVTSSSSLSSSYDIRPAYIGVVYIIRVV